MHGNNVPVSHNPDALAGAHFLRLAFRRIHQNLAALTENDDGSTTTTANAVLGDGK